MKRKLGTKAYHQELEKAIGESRLREIEEMDAELKQLSTLLDNDPLFTEITIKLTGILDGLYEKEPEAIKGFFKQFGIPTLKRLPAINKYLESVSEDVRDALLAYAKYVDRFQHHLRFSTRKPHFQPNPLAPEGFHFKLRFARRKLPSVPHISTSKKGKTNPSQPADISVSEIERFESKLENIPNELRPFVEAKVIKFVEIDDDCGSSVLSVVERIAYHPNGITVVIHNALHPYLFCLVGEMMTDAQWKKAYAAVSAILRQQYSRSKPGRRRDTKKMKLAAHLLPLPGDLKSKASQLAEKSASWLSSKTQDAHSAPEEEMRIGSAQVYLSRFKSRNRDVIL
jgi:hypothetical protein